MMDPEDLQSDLLALRRLYGLLVKDEHYVEDAGFEHLDDNTRRLLINLLDPAANKAFDAHAKILDTQFKATYSSWSTPQGQPGDILSLKSFSVRNAPSLQNVDLLTGQGALNEPMSQVDLAGELGSRMKRCRVCQKPKVKQLTKEISFRDTNNILQNHKRRWEVENEPSTVGSSLDGPFFSILTNQEDHISREASTKILQLESCISSLQVAVKHANFLKSESVNEDKRFDPNSSTSLRIWKPRDTGQQWREQSLVNTMLPSSQIISQQVEEPVVKRTETFNPIQNQYDDTPDEAYYLFHKSENFSNVKKPADENRFLTSQLSKQCEKTPVNTMLPSSQITSQQVEEPFADKIEMFDPIQNEYDNIPDEAYYPLHSGGNSSNAKTPADKNQSLHGNLSSQMSRQQLGQLQMAKPEALVNTMLPSSRITSQQVVQPVADKTDIFNPRKMQCDFDKGGNSSVATKPADKNRVLNRQQVDQLQKAKTEALVKTMLPSSQVKSQLVEEPVADKVEMLNPRQNKYDNIPNVKKPADKNQFLHRTLSRQMSRQQLGQSRKAKTEALDNTMLPSSQVTSQQVVGQSQKAKTNIPPEKNHFLRRNVSSQTSRQQLDQFQMAKTEAVGSYEITEWQDPLVGYGKPSNEQQKAKPSKTYTDQMDYYRGKHDAVDPKRSVSVASKRISESPVSSSNYSTQVQSPSQSPSPSPTPSYHSLNDSEGSLLDHREVYSESSGSKGREKSETELSLVLSQYQGPNKGGSFEPSRSMSRKPVPKKGHERGDPKDSNRKLENKMTTVSSRDQSPYRNSSSNESSRSNATEMVPKQGHKNSIPKEPKRKDESKNNTVSSRDQISSTSSRSHESSGSESGRMVPIKCLQKGNKKELKRSSSNEYSGSGSESGSGRMDPKKGHLKPNQKELKRSESGSSNEFSGSGSESGSGSGSESGSGSGSESGSGSGSGSGSLSSGSGSGSGSGSRSGSGSQSGSGSRSGSGSHSVSGSESGSGSGSGSATRQRERKGKEKELDINTGSSEDQGSYTGSSSNESSRSSSSKTDQKEPEKNQGWRLGKLKDKLAVIFHHHHHHHHHNGDDDNDHDENDDGSHKDNYKKAWKQTKKIIGHSSKTGAHAAKIIGKETKKIIGHGSKTGAHAAVIIGKETKKIIGHGSKTGAHAAVIIGKETKKIIGHGSKTGAHAAKIIGKETKKIIGHGSKTGAHAAKILGKQALVYEAHAEHAVRKMASTAVKKIEKKALEAKKHKHHDSHAAKKSESRGLGISQAHGEHAVHDSKALVVVNDHEGHGSHEVKDESKALVLVNDGGHSDHSVKKNENLALVLVNDGGHGSHSVKNESKALVLVKDAGHGSHAVKTESKALVVPKSVGKKPKAQLQSLVGGLLKPSKDSTKSSKSKSATKGTSGASSSAKKQGSSSSSGGGNLKNNIAWLKMLKQKRRLERMEKLRRKVGTGKKS